MELFLYRQEPIDVFRERVTRMRLVAFAPLISYLVLLISVAVYKTIIQRAVIFPTIDTSALTWSIIWLIALVNLIRLAGIKKFLNNPSTIFRFLFDMPVLIVMLVWILFCFYLTGGFEYPFLITLYALFVYSGSRMISIPFYMFGTHAVGISLCFFVQSYYLEVFQVAAPAQLTKGAITEAFISLYVGLFFPYIQDTFVWLFRQFAKVLSILLHPVYADDDQP